LNGTFGDKRIGVRSEIVTGALDLRGRLHDPDYLRRLHAGFAVDAWLGNRDVIGKAYDNVITDADGEPTRIDAGGTLLFTGFGELKGDDFGAVVHEIDTLRNQGRNREAASVFQDIRQDDIRAGVAMVDAVADARIDSRVDSLGFPPEVGDALKSVLKARRHDLIDRFPSTDAATVEQAARKWLYSRIQGSVWPDMPVESLYSELVRGVQLGRAADAALADLTVLKAMRILEEHSGSEGMYEHRLVDWLASSEGRQQYESQLRLEALLDHPAELPADSSAGWSSKASRRS